MAKEKPEMKAEERKRIKETLRYLEQNRRSLTQSADTFIQSLKKYFARNKNLSEKQARALFEIANNLQ